jgi:type I restriction enzyme S subunit
MSAEGWEAISLEEAIEFKNGKSSHERKDIGLNPVFGGNGIIGYTEESNSDFETIVVGRVGAYCGSVYYYKGKCWVTDNAIIGKVKQPYEGLYLFYLMKMIDLNSHRTGSSQPLVNQSILNSIQVKVPRKKVTQTRIAAILSALDDKIELNRQTNATLEAIAQAIFKEWFVDFRFPGATGEMQDSEFGQIPKGWRVGRIGDICELNPKLTLRKGTISKYVEMKNLSQCLLSIEEPRKREFVSGSKFQNGDTLFARITPCLENGKTGFVDFLTDLEIGWGSTEFIVLRGRNYINPYFIYCLSRLSNFREFAIQSMVGSSGRQRVVESILSDYPTVIPDQETVNNFLNVVEKMFFQVKNNSDQSATVAKIRDSLLPKLMSGEIEV